MELVSINSKLIDVGGHSTIYQDFDQPFIRKTYKPDDVFFVNWLREVGCLRLLRKSPFTIDYLRLGQDIILPKYDYNLSEFLFKYQPSLKTRINIFYQILNGVLEIHSKGFIHRDLKSLNIMINEDSLNTVIIDFGGCTQGYIDSDYLENLDTNQPQVNKTLTVSTLAYQAPELNHNFPQKYKSYYYDNKIDIWSLGVIGLEMFFGNVLLHGSIDQNKNWELIIKNFSSFNIEDIHKNPDLITQYTPIRNMCFKQYFAFPSELMCILNSMLQINPENRCNVWDIVNHIFFREIYGIELINVPKKLDIIDFFDDRFNYISNDRIYVCGLAIRFVDEFNIHPKCYFDIIKMYDIYVKNAKDQTLYDIDAVVYSIAHIVTILNYSYMKKLKPNHNCITVVYHILKTINYQVYNATPYDYLMATVIDLNIDPKMTDILVSVLVVTVRGSLDSCDYKKLVATVIKYVFKDTIDLELIDIFFDYELSIKIHELVLDYEENNEENNKFIL